MVKFEQIQHLHNLIGDVSRQFKILKQENITFCERIQGLQEELAVSLKENSILLAHQKQSDEQIAGLLSNLERLVELSKEEPLSITDPKLLGSVVKKEQEITHAGEAALISSTVATSSTIFIGTSEEKLTCEIATMQSTADSSTANEVAILGVTESKSAIQI